MQFTIPSLGFEIVPSKSKKKLSNPDLLLLIIFLSQKVNYLIFNSKNMTDCQIIQAGVFTPAHNISHLISQLKYIP